jgi:hypothetical protein
MLKKKISYLNKVMEYIVNEIPECKLLIICDLKGTGKLIKIIDNINLLNTIIKVIKIQNVMLKYMIFLKIYSIDYIAIFESGINIIYDDILPELLAEKSVNILEDKEYKIILGMEGRKNMKKFNNDLLLTA